MKMSASDDNALLVLHNEHFVQNHKHRFNNFLQSEELSDVILACQGHFMKAHRVVLAAGSTFFSEMFKLCSSKHLTVVLNDVTQNQMESILQFIYTGQCEIKQDEIMTFLKTADSLKVEGLCSKNKGNNEDPSRPEKSMESPNAAARSTVLPNNVTKSTEKSSNSANNVTVSAEQKMQTVMVEKAVRNMKVERPALSDDEQPIEQECFFTDIPSNTQEDDDNLSENYSSRGRDIKRKKIKRNDSRRTTSDGSTGMKRVRERNCDSDVSDDSLVRRILASSPVDQQTLDEIQNTPIPATLEDALPSTSQDEEGTRQNLFYVCKKVMMLENKIKKIFTNDTNIYPELKVPLPCIDAKRVFVLEQLLQEDQEQYASLIQSLSVLTSTSVRLVVQVNTRLRYIMDGSAAIEFCLNGSSTKYEFKNLKICHAVIESVVSVNKADISRDYVMKLIGLWFNQALKRIHNRVQKKGSEEGVRKRKIRELPRLEEMETSHSSEVDSE